MLRLHDSIFELVLHAKAKASVYRQLQELILLAAALLIVPQVEFNFEVILYITILVFVSPRSCFKSAIRFQSIQIVMLFKAVKGGKIIHQKSLKGLCIA